MYFYGGNNRPPRGRSGKVYLTIALIGVVLGCINETLGALFIVFGCYLAWVSS